MNYIGSKYSLLPFLVKVVEDIANRDLSNLVFCDLFAGTGIVGRTFKPMVKKILRMTGNITVMCLTEIILAIIGRYVTVIRILSS